MNCVARKAAVVFAVLALLLSVTKSQERSVDSRQIGRFIRDMPMPKVTRDKDGAAIVGGDAPLFLRRDTLLVVTEVRPRDSGVERFLEFPTTGESKSVRVVDKATEACYWFVMQRLVGHGFVDPKHKGNMTVKIRERFIASAGPFKDHFLCIDEQNRLVLEKEPEHAIVRQVEYEDHWDGK